MFNPTSISAKLFRKYLRSGNHPSKVRIQNILGKNLFGGGLHVINEAGTKFSLTANDWITRTILTDGGYETASILLCKKLVEHGGVFIDIGANFGLYSCILSANRSVDVFSIEPNYMVIPSLLRNIKLNERNNVTVLNVALSNDFQFVSFNLENPNNLGTASFEILNEASFSVLSCSLEFIFKSKQIQEVELVKIDIEGNEFAVLKDFPFEKYTIKNILLEYNNLSSKSLKELGAFFSARGFIMQDIQGRPFKTFTEEIPENNLWLVNTQLNHVH